MACKDVSLRVGEGRSRASRGGLECEGSPPLAGECAGDCFLGRRVAEMVAC